LGRKNRVHLSKPETPSQTGVWEGERKNDKPETPSQTGVWEGEKKDDKEKE